MNPIQQLQTMLDCMKSRMDPADVAMFRAGLDQLLPIPAASFSRPGTPSEKLTRHLRDLQTVILHVDFGDVRDELNALVIELSSDIDDVIEAEEAGRPRAFREGCAGAEWADVLRGKRPALRLVRP